MKVLISFVGSLISATFLLALLGASPAGQAADFKGLGDLAGGAFDSRAWAVSADGLYVAGKGTQENGEEAFVWSKATGMMTGLGGLPGGMGSGSEAFAVASDGGPIAAGIADALQWSEAFRWTPAGGMVSLGLLPGDPPLKFSRAWGISQDTGSVIVGRSSSPEGTQAFWWTQGGGMQGMGDLPGGAFSSEAYAVDEGNPFDGAIAVGRGTSVNGNEAFRWVQATGMMGLGDLPGGGFGSEARALSGNTVVGFGTAAAGREAVRWTIKDGMVDGMVSLGDLAGGDVDSQALGVSANGRIVGIGSVADPNFDTSRAFLWTANKGMRDLREVLVNDHNLNLNNWTLRAATGISADGITIVGYGKNPNGKEEAWRAIVPLPQEQQIPTLPEWSLMALGGLLLLVLWRRLPKPVAGSRCATS